MRCPKCQSEDMVLLHHYVTTKTYKFVKDNKQGKQLGRQTTDFDDYTSNICCNNCGANFIASYIGDDCYEIGREL
jgi:ribosomal protein S27E